MSDNKPVYVHLTPREVVVLALLAEGKTDAEIAGVLNISPKTVNHRVEAIKRKFGVGTRVEAVVRAMRLQIIH